MKPKHTHRINLYFILGIIFLFFGSVVNASNSAVTGSTTEENEAGVQKEFVYSFSSGWNYFSFCLRPDVLDIKQVLVELIEKNLLIKVQDELGRTLENTGSDWLNEIGDLSLQKGYKIRVSEPCIFKLQGRRIPLIPSINLKKGWNMMPFNLLEETDALTVLRDLIENEALLMVKDEKGLIISYVEGHGWVNEIGNFQPGKAYDIKVKNSCTLLLKKN